MRKSGQVAGSGAQPNRLFLLCTAGLVVLAVLAGWWSVRLARAGFLVARMRGDDLATFVAPAVENPARAWERAAELSPADFRIPYWEGLACWVAASPLPEDPIPAHALFLRAAQLAPTVAEVRYYLAVSSLALGKAAEADEQAEAALTSAPLNFAIRSRVGDYFYDRYRQTRERADLTLAFRAWRAAHSPRVQEVLSDWLLTYPEIEKVLTAAGLDRGERADLYLDAGRYTWAEETLLPDQADSPRFGRVEEEYGKQLLGLGAAEDARVRLTRARKILGRGFSAWAELGAACYLAGKEDEAGRVLAEALRDGVAPATVRTALSRGGVKGKGAVAFWRGLPPDLAARARVRLELARALIDADDPRGADSVLRTVPEEAETRGEESYLFARAFAAVGNLSAAIRHASAAVAAEPGVREYARLLEALRKRSR